MLELVRVTSRLQLMSVLLPTVPMDITVITPTLARLTDITARPISAAAFLSARVRGSMAAITRQATVAVRDSATSVAAGSAAASVVDSGAAINSALVVGSGAASLVAAGDVNRRKSRLFCKRLALIPAVSFLKTAVRQLPACLETYGTLPYGKLRIKLEAEDLMLGAADFDTAREFIEKLSALRGQSRQKTMSALLKLAVGVKLGDQLALVGV